MTGTAVVLVLFTVGLLLANALYELRRGGLVKLRDVRPYDQHRVDRDLA